jgi:fatty acid desaturase
MGWMEADLEMENRRVSKVWKLVVQGLPLAAAVASLFFPLQRIGQQFVVLIVLIWLQVYFILECFLARY